MQRIYNYWQARISQSIRLSTHSEQGDGEWLKHIYATLEQRETTLLPIESIENLQEKCPDSIEPQLIYQKFSTLGSYYGPSYQCIENCKEVANARWQLLRLITLLLDMAIIPSRILAAALQAIELYS